MYSQENINQIIKKLIEFISEELEIKGVYLFGSYANGNPEDYSDIDLAIISDDFDGDRFSDRKRLNKFIIKTSLDIEIHPFKTKDFSTDNPFVTEIIRTGKKIV
ncbi:MAG: nucleotidyltransferase domain-containing protein [Ignavibacteriales bacterium]|nr:nucleotidyltransferase domain-containing protein [Ignavibacteriales bacterium]